MSITSKHLQRYCMWGQGSLQCRYLDEADFNHPNQCFCLKKTGEKAKDINTYTNEKINELNSKGTKLANSDYPLGDNCPGFLFLTEIEQGYNVKKK